MNLRSGPAAPDPALPNGTWTDAVASIVARFEVAAAVGGSAVWNATGSRATGELMKTMARLLDVEARGAIATRDTAIEEIVAKNARLMQVGLEAVEHIKELQQECNRLYAQLDAHGIEHDPR
ncbi:hypothetical protein ACOI1H_16345 [Loktanella sp. DJP18]|uniref:hypothetical protein n=1 Tax=Loktanella sp. DJP18 TaxID=3409788 RepID=UPI003BB5B1C1